MMAKSSKASIQKKIERLRKTQEINEIVERGSVEEQALLDSAGESRPADESHVSDLLSTAQQQSDVYRENRSSPKKLARKSPQRFSKRTKAKAKAKAKKAKKSRR